MSDQAIAERLMSVLSRLNGVQGGQCRRDHLVGAGDEDLQELLDLDLVEHVHTRPMLVRKHEPLRHIVEDVAVYKITDAGRRVLQAYYDEAGRKRLEREGRRAS